MASPIIVSRTPFRIPLGGGSTDLPAYYEKYGGFVFSAAVNLYMHIGINRPPADDLIRVKYRESEEVAQLSDLKHKLARAALQRVGITKMIEITSTADVSDGTGMGSSGSYLVGLLNGLHALKGERLSGVQLAEEAFSIATQDLGLPDGKQDFYLAALGNFCVLDIATNGRVTARYPNISKEVQENFEKRSLLFYTGVRRSSADLLTEQAVGIKENKQDALEAKHAIKKIGQEVLAAFEKGDLDSFGRLMDEHWKIKRNISVNMSNDNFDVIYEQAKKAGALGGKIMGAGGGGFFLIYCPEGKQNAVRKVFSENNLREVSFAVETGGSQVVLS